MSMPTHADIINRERKRAADAMTEKLQKLDVGVKVAHYTGDSSYPTEYTIIGAGAQETGPTFELTLMGWIEELIKNKVKAANEPECTLLGTSTSMPNSEFERKTYLFSLKDGEKKIDFNLQVHADGTIVAEPRPPHEVDYDDLDDGQDDYEEDDCYDDIDDGDEEE